MALEYGIPFGIPHSPRVTEMGIEELTPRQYAFKLLRKDVKIIHHLYVNTEPLHTSFTSTMKYYNEVISKPFVPGETSACKFLSQEYLFALSQVIALSSYNNDRPDRKAQHRRRVDLAKHFDVHKDLDDLTYWVTLDNNVVLLTLSHEIATQWATRLTMLHSAERVKSGCSKIGDEKSLAKFKKVYRNDR